MGVDDLRKAEVFYSDVLVFNLLERESDRLVYDPGHFTLYVNDRESHPPVPSFTVQDLQEAKRLPIENRCEITVGQVRSLYFKDPFSIVYDVIER